MSPSPKDASNQRRSEIVISSIGPEDTIPTGILRSAVLAPHTAPTRHLVPTLLQKFLKTYADTHKLHSHRCTIFSLRAHSSS